MKTRIELLVEISKIILKDNSMIDPNYLANRSNQILEELEKVNNQSQRTQRI